MAPSTPSYRLSTGADIPALGFGTYSGDPGTAHVAVLHALKSGFRHIDTAWGYDNENEVGSAVKEFLDTNKDGVKRADLFITTKVPDHLHEPEDVEWSVKDSLKKLGLEYVDLALLHWPVALVKKEDRSEQKTDANGKIVINQALTDNPRPTWEAMEKLHDQGLAKSIGVSNFSITGLESLLKYARIPPAVNQCEAHPLLPNTKLIDYCKTKSIVFEAYSPLGGQGADNPLFNDTKLKQVAEKYGHSVVQVLIAWHLRRGYVVLPKSFTPARIEANLKVVDLTEDEFAAVAEAVNGKTKRTCPYWADKSLDIWAESE